MIEAWKDFMKILFGIEQPQPLREETPESEAWRQSSHSAASPNIYRGTHPLVCMLLTRL